MSDGMNHEASAGNYLKTNRIEALHDGVFAIVMTLLVFDMKVDAGGTHADLMKNLSEIWPILAAYFITFVNLGVYWIGQQNQFHFIKYADRLLLWINIIFLMLVALLPFSTSLLGDYPREPISYQIYGLNLVLIGAMSYLHWRYATKHHRLTDHDITDTVTRNVQQRIAFGVAISLIAIAASFLTLRLSLIFYIMLPLYYIKPGKVDGTWRREAVAHTH